MNVFAHQPASPAAAITALPLVVSVEKACGWAKTDPDDPDMEDIIRAAMDWVEQQCQQPIFERNFVVTLRRFEPGMFASLHVSQIVSVKYRPKGSTALNVLDSSLYELYQNEISFDSVVLDLNADRVEITFTAGFKEADVPPSILMAIRLYIAFRYDNRADHKDAAPTAAENYLSDFHLQSV